MSTLATVLKDEIRRLARKEIKAQTGAMARTVAQHRRELAALKRQLREQDKKLAVLRKVARSGGEPAVLDETESNPRFSARSAKAQRRRTGLSAADYARLVGVSPLTIYSWENGKSRPRKEQFAALVSLRGVGKREVQARLASQSRPRTTRVRTTRRRRAS